MLSSAGRHARDCERRIMRSSSVHPRLRVAGRCPSQTTLSSTSPPTSSPTRGLTYPAQDPHEPELDLVRSCSAKTFRRVRCNSWSPRRATAARLPVVTAAGRTAVASLEASTGATWASHDGQSRDRSRERIWPVRVSDLAGLGTTITPRRRLPSRRALDRDSAARDR